MILFTVLIGGFAVLLALPVTILFLEVVFAVAPHDDRKAAETGERPTLAIVMPAHNEAFGITETLRSIMPQLAASDRLLVVADNCSDDTAVIAGAEGAEVVVRTNLELRGKSYALDFAISHLRRDPPQVVIIIDADCHAADGSIDRLARLCKQTARPVQALYLMRAPEGARITTRVAEFAWIVINQVRPEGLSRLGLPCHLTGTGMAFPWSCISTANLASGHLVEDRKLGFELARAGTPPLFCPKALVTSQYPTSSVGIRSQRTRWEHGSLGLTLSDAPRAFLEGLFRLNPDTMVLGLDMFVPPLALLTLLIAISWLASTVLYFFARTHFPLVISSMGATLLLLSVFLSWFGYGRQTISLIELGSVGLYALRKIPLYAKFLFSRQLEWVRSNRDDEERRPGP